MIRIATELSVIGVVLLASAIPWHNITFLPPALLLSIAIGASLAVVCIPDDRRTFRISLTTALAGIGLGLLATEAAIEWLQISSAAYAKVVAGVLGLGGLPIAGMTLRLIDSATNNPTHWLGVLMRKFIPPSDKDAEPPTGRA
jgi:hypothetical protein